jgi:protein-S-isoprenylcysteine O-methyltransferase Ste14
MKRRLFAWLGGAMFVGALAYCLWSFLVTWSEARRPGTFAGWSAVAFDAALFTVFALHHSVLARERVKNRIGRLIPGDLLRPVYVWIASLLLILTCALWQPTGRDLYAVAGVRVFLHAAVQLIGLWLIAQSVRAIDPLELAGIREPAAGLAALQTAGPYRLVRHPLYLGWVLAAFGPGHMTGDRLAFAVISSLYLVLAVPWEERSLEHAFGEAYAAYKRRVRWRMIPFVY